MDGIPLAKQPVTRRAELRADVAVERHERSRQSVTRISRSAGERTGMSIPAGSHPHNSARSGTISYLHCITQLRRAVGVRSHDTRGLRASGAARAGRVRARRGGAPERRPVVTPAYGGALHQPNLTPLVAFILQRLGIPVLIHGTLEGHGRIATA